MRLASSSAVLLVLLTFNGAPAETVNPKQQLQRAELTTKSTPAQSPTFRGKSLQSDSLKGFAANVTTKSLGLETPVFGFESSFGWQSNSLGERVTGVQFGGLASRLELKPGDMIIGVNGQELKTADGWQNAIQRAANQDGWVTLKVLDGRSGKLAYRTANLFQPHDR